MWVQDRGRIAVGELTHWEHHRAVPGYHGIQQLQSTGEDFRVGREGLEAMDSDTVTIHVENLIFECTAVVGQLFKDTQTAYYMF